MLHTTLLVRRQKMTYGDPWVVKCPHEWRCHSSFPLMVVGIRSYESADRRVAVAGTHCGFAAPGGCTLNMLPWRGVVQVEELPPRLTKYCFISVGERFGRFSRFRTKCVRLAGASMLTTHWHSPLTEKLGLEI